MRVNETCAACLYDKQKTRSNDPAYLESVRRIIDQRRESDTSPYLVYLFDQAYERQGNYESLCGQGRHIFYSFLCKCGLFTERFQVPKLTGMLVEE